MSVDAVTLDPVVAQLGAVRRRYPDARVEVSADGQRVLIVPNVPIRAGWNKNAAAIFFLVPVGYPQVKLDCFYVDADLRLANGEQPGQSAIQQVFGSSYLWFSWHITEWNPANASLDQYVRVCEARLREVR
jgi:hypothetical protein